MLDCELSERAAETESGVYHNLNIRNADNAIMIQIVDSGVHAEGFVNDRLDIADTGG